MEVHRTPQSRRMSLAHVVFDQSSAQRFKGQVVEAHGLNGRRRTCGSAFDWECWSDVDDV